MDVFQERVKAMDDTAWPRMAVHIDKERYIYDREMPQISYEVDETAEGCLMKSMVVEVNKAEILATLQNSKIVGCK